MNIKSYLNLFASHKRPYDHDHMPQHGDPEHFYKVTITFPDKDMVGTFVDFNWEKIKTSTPHNIMGTIIEEYDLSQVDGNWFSGFLHYKNKRLEFKGLDDLSFRKIRLFKLKVNVSIFSDKFTSMWLGNKNLRIKQQYDVLKAVYELTVKDEQFILNKGNIIQQLYGSKWSKYKNYAAINREVSLYLQAFVDTGDLDVASGFYNLTPKSLLTIKKYEEEIDRYNTSKKMQLIAIWTAGISCVAAIASAITAYLSYIKPPH